MQTNHLISWLAAAAFLYALPLTGARAAGRYTLAFWREAGAYENQAPPAGESGNHSAFVHVWDESGQGLAGKPIYTSWGVLLGITDANGFVEIELRRPNGYDFQVRGSGQLTDTTPIFSEERAPTWGHYSFEIGFLFKQNAGQPGWFDTGYAGTINASGSDPCADLSAPRTLSLAFSSTDPTAYCSDAYTLGNWAASHGQSFIATGNRVIALKALMAAGFNVHHYWTVQILEGGPDGSPVGPPRTTRLHLDTEYYPILIKWGINDVQVVPGRTYYARISRAEGINAFRVNRDNDPGGNYFENGTPIPGSELMGAVVCATFTNAGPTGLLTGIVRDTNNVPLPGAVVTVPDAGLYALTEADGTYTLSFLPTGTYVVTASKPGYVTGQRQGIVIDPGLTSLSDFTLAPAPVHNDGLIVTPAYILQPFEALPAWSSSFDASWGSAATFSTIGAGQTGSALQASRGGPGSSARVQVFPIRPDTPYQLGIWIRCPASSSAYWAECAYRLGTNSAQDFDANAAAWTLVKKFSDTGANGNGNAWTRYVTNINSGAATQISVGWKLGAPAGTGPTVQWDQFSLVSLALPGIALALADSLTQVQVRFADPVTELTATNPANYRLTSATGPLAILRAPPPRHRPRRRLSQRGPR